MHSSQPHLTRFILNRSSTWAHYSQAQVRLRNNLGPPNSSNSALDAGVMLPKHHHRSLGRVQGWRWLPTTAASFTSLPRDPVASGGWRHNDRWTPCFCRERICPIFGLQRGNGQNSIIRLQNHSSEYLWVTSLKGLSMGVTIKQCRPRSSANRSKIKFRRRTK